MWLVLPAAGCVGALRIGDVHGLQPGIQFLLGLRPAYAVAFLQLAEELVLFTCDHLNVIVGELAKFLANGSFQLISFGCGYFRTTANARGMSEFG